MRILLAEDDVTTRMIVKELLGKWGFEIETAVDGNEAWEKLSREESPQLAILDWVMPGMDGITLCKKLRENDRKKYLYIILLTSNTRKDQLLSGLDAGADDFISKPYDSREFKARIDVGIRLINMHNELREHDKLLGALEMSGAICHEMNQPLQTIMGFSELLLLDVDPDSDNYKYLQQIKESSKRLGDLTKKIMGVTKYKKKQYMGSEREIVDLDQSSQDK